MKQILLTLCLLWGLAASAQDTTTHRHTLTGVQVEAVGIPPTNTAQAPTQVLSSTTLQQSGVTTLSQAATHLSGVTLKDYGGVGGIKTISSRGLGSQFSTLTIDGIAVTDCQNGQIDLGRYPLGDADYISFAQGLFTQTLQSARSLAAGNVLNMETHVPDSALQGLVGFEGGSFGLLSPTFSLRQRINSRWAYSLWANRMQSEGNYPFTLAYTLSGTDSTSQERREHSAMEVTNMEGNLFWTGNHQQLLLKVRHSEGEHQLPGPVVYYAKRGTEQTENRCTFAQARYRHSLSDRLRLQLLAKWSRVDDAYSDTAIHKNILNTYQQEEAYLSATLAYEPLDRLFLTLATDEAFATLHSNLAHNNAVQRLSSQNVLTLNFRRSAIDLAAHLLFTLSDEHTNDGIHHHYQRLSPYLGANINLWNGEHSHLRMRLFAKENYRLPNFNELYFFTLTRSLNPEKAWQCNAGLTLACLFDSLSLNASLDAYYNRVTDKIVAIPTQNLFLWSMSNVGRVDVSGLDALVEASWGNLSMQLNYSLQRALDMTDPASKTYGNQIAYTPRHSGGATLSYAHRIATLSYTLLCVGRRYYLGENTLSTLVRGYCDQGITLSRAFSWRWGSIDLRLQVLNIFNVQYEVVRNYPMMGRNYRLTINYKF